MRNEIRYKWIIAVLTFLLVAAPIAVQVRLYKAAPYVTIGISGSQSGSENPGGNGDSGSKPSNSDGTAKVGIAGSISTRDGEIVYDGVNTKYPAFYAVVGNVTSNSLAKHLSEHTLAYRYQDVLAASKLTVVGGLHTFKGRSGSRMTTTLLPGPTHQTLYEAFDEYNGALVAYNYRTGEILVLVSVPSAQSGNEGDAYLTNRVLGTYSPGSTIKIITLICALSQNPELENFTYTCTGSYALSGSEPVTCGAAHYGPLTMRDAIGHSCNCYFAALIGQLDVNDTRDVLEELGFSTVKGESGTGNVDRLTYTKGYSAFRSTKSFDEVWRLIGSGSVVSMIDMVRIAGAVVNGGEAADPYIVETIYNPNKEKVTYQAEKGSMTQLVDPEVADNLSEMWSDAVEEYYYTRSTPLDRRISHAKTGTSELIDANGEEYNNRLLLGVMEEENVAFMLVVEHLPAGSSKIITIANTLAQIISEADF